MKSAPTLLKWLILVSFRNVSHCGSTNVHFTAIHTEFWETRLLRAPYWLLFCILLVCPEWLLGTVCPLVSSVAFNKYLPSQLALCQSKWLQNTSSPFFDCFSHSAGCGCVHSHSQWPYVQCCSCPSPSCPMKFCSHSHKATTCSGSMAHSSVVNTHAHINN